MSQEHLSPRRLAGDDLSADERRALLAHVRVCATCRERWAAGDPTRLFSLLVLDEPSPHDMERLSSRVADAIDLEARPGSRRRRAWMPVAAAVVLAGLLGSYLWDGAPGTGPRIVPVETSGPTAAVGEFELLSSPGTAEVHDLVVGDTHLVMIFDEALDL